MVGGDESVLLTKMDFMSFALMSVRKSCSCFKIISSQSGLRAPYVATKIANFCCLKGFFLRCTFMLK